MNEDEIPASDQVSTPQEAWSTPASQIHLPPTSMGGFSYCLPADQSSQPFHVPQEVPSRPISAHQDFHHHSTQEESECPRLAYLTMSPAGANWALDYWMQKPFENQFHFQGAMADVPIGQAFTSDEAISVFDLEHQEGLQSNFQLNLDDVTQSRRISGSSFTMSTSGALSDMQSYDDFSTALSDAPSFYSEFPPTSNRTSWMSSTQLSPVASPRMGPSSRSDLVRTQSRGRASPSPRPNVRSAPYVIDGPRNNKRWSTGSYGNMSSRRPAPFIYHAGSEVHMAHQRTLAPKTPHADRRCSSTDLLCSNLSTSIHVNLSAATTAKQHAASDPTSIPVAITAPAYRLAQLRDASSSLVPRATAYASEQRRCACPPQPIR